MEIKIRCTFQEMVPIAELQPHEKNPHKHTDEQIERLAKLYEYHGIRHPIIVSTRSGKIVAGHGRREAALSLGMTSFPVDYQDFESDEAEYAFIVADNAIGKDSWASLDLSAINIEIGDLGPEFDLDMLGLKDFHIDVPSYDLDDEIKDKDGERRYVLEVQFPNDMEMMDVHDDLLSRGYIVKVK